LDIAVSFRTLYSVRESSCFIHTCGFFSSSVPFKTPPYHAPLLLPPSANGLNLALNPRVARVATFHFKLLDTSRKDSSQLQDISFLLWLQDRKTN